MPTSRFHFIFCLCFLLLAVMSNPTSSGTFDHSEERKMTRGKITEQEKWDDGGASCAATQAARAGGADRHDEVVHAGSGMRAKQQEKELSRQELRWQKREHQLWQIQAQVTEITEEQHQEVSNSDDHQEEMSRPRSAGLQWDPLIFAHLWKTFSASGSKTLLNLMVLEQLLRMVRSGGGNVDSRAWSAAEAAWMAEVFQEGPQHPAGRASPVGEVSLLGWT